MEISENLNVKCPQLRNLQEDRIWGVFHTGNYIFQADGNMSFGQIKDGLCLKNGALRESNPSVFNGINGNADKAVPPEGTKLLIRYRQLPLDRTEAGLRTIGGEEAYVVQKGDTKQKLSAKGFNMDGYPERTLQPGQIAFKAP